MPEDYALLAKLRDLDEALEQAEYWFHQYRVEPIPRMRGYALRFHLEYHDKAQELMRLVAEHGKEK